ncbi:MAG TPA: DMT family transporter [Clostridiaceae bacterium]
MKNKTFLNVLAICLITIWGISYLSIKVVVMEINPVLTAFYRFFIASIIMFVFLKFKYPKEKILNEDKLKIVLGGFFGVALYFLLENYSVYFTSAANVSILIATIPVFTLITQRIFFKEKITIPKIAGTSISIIGIVFVIAAKGEINLFSTGLAGDLMAIGAAICWVIYNMVSCNFKGKYKSITITTYQLICGCIFLSPSLLIFPMKIPSLTASLNILFLAVVCSAISYVVYVYCLDHLGATILTNYINIQPIISILAAKIILNESITTNQIIGSVIIILGVSIVTSGNYKYNESNNAI